ncbi:MAG TPA: prolyl oligopeptidase family serine peptidase [Acetobacteraceae bacterium]|nr:prolyl oligopeptidase family serine peptidase [Acetobacteraceae bacterium]
MRFCSLRLCAGLLVTLPLHEAAAAPVPTAPNALPPVADVKPVTDTYFGTTIIDNYRWMEGEPSPAFRSFLSASKTFADDVIGRVRGIAKLQKDIDSFSGPYVTVSDMTPDGETLFYLRRGPKDDVARLVTRGASTGDERVLVDPETLPDARPHSEIDQIAPSPDGAYVAFGLQDNGPDSTVLRVFDSAQGVMLGEHIPGARFAAVSWLPDSSGFYYTRPADGGSTNRPRLRLAVFLHKLGSKTDRDVLTLDAAYLPFPYHARTVVPRLVLPPGSDYALAVLSNGVGQDIAVYSAPISELGEHPAPWRGLAEEGDGVTEISVSGPIAFLLTHAQAPTFRVVSEDLADPGFATARTVMPAGDGVITGIAAAADALYAARRAGSGMQLLRLDYNQSVAEQIRLPFAGTIAPAYGGSGGLIADPRVNGTFLSLESWMHPKVWLRYDLRVHRITDPSIMPVFPRDVSAYQAIETTATGDDGTKIPLSLIARRDVAKDKARPVLLEAFGSYGYAYDARYLPIALAWADQGGVFAVAHVRGGGELGRPWHDAGRLGAKANSMLDLLACARALAAQGYSNPAKIAASGTNAGALTVAGAMLRDPGAFRAVLLRAGLLNPLRSEEYPNGAANIAEFGSAHDPMQFKSLFALDPYEHVQPGTAYPAVLLTGSLADPVAPAWHAAKMAARLMADSSSGRPILLRVSQDGGSPNRADQEELQAEELGFLLWQLDMPDFAEAPAAPPRARGRHKGLARTEPRHPA